MSMPNELMVGLSSWSLTVPAKRAVEVTRTPFAAPPPLAELVQKALDKPFGFEPLRRALTPDDRVTIVLDSQLPKVAEILEVVLGYLRTALIPPELVTVLTTPEAPQNWSEQHAVEFAGVKREIHDPADRKKLAYLASTREGRRIYLNRTLVDGDFIIVLTGRGYDPLAGYAGAEVAIFPALGDDENRNAFQGQVSIDAPGEEAWSIRVEAEEVVRMLGMPFFVQIIEGAGDTVQDVVAGLLESSPEGVRRQDARWFGTVTDEPDTVVAAISGEPERVTFMDLAKAAVCAARVAPKGSRIAVLTAATPTLGDGAQLLRSMDSPAGAKRFLAKRKPADWSACRLWAYVVKNYSIFLASGLPDAVAEELFTTPIHGQDEVQRLIDSGEKVLLIPDAHKTILATEE
ncbi:MAG: lactate racemase domain-containing protein [Planctomycetes bacterium]|nr:lactate racemase domain-containing protein [Planctomycetota bacterium]